MTESNADEAHEEAAGSKQTAASKQMGRRARRSWPPPALARAANDIRRRQQEGVPPPEPFTRVPAVRYGYIWWPPVDIEETPDAYVVSAELAGVDRNDIEIELQGSEVIVSGKVSAGPFAYSVTLPEPVEADDVDARLEDGILKLTDPKAERSHHRKIELKA